MTLPAFEVEAAHPVFALSVDGSLLPPVAGEPRELWRHLSARIARDPLDLETHARRVLLAGRAPLTSFAFGAMLDLFLALGPRGRALRDRLLGEVAGWLEPDELHFLSQHLDAGLLRGTPLPDAPGSVYHDARVGSTQMVSHERVAAAERTAHEQAVSLLEDGDLGGARQLLEDALLADPTDAVVARELLGIYHHSRDAAAQAAMTERLQARHGHLPPAWA